MRAWIDIDNPPQARYLLPVARRFEQAGHDVLLTARAYGDTFAILRSEGAAFEAIGLSFETGLPGKLYGLGRRARTLVDFVRRQATPVDILLTGSRAATLAARHLGIPSFVIIDYEHVNLLFYELSGSHILYPSVIDGTAFRRRGVTRKHLMPFEGLKEGISFASLDLSSIPPHDFADGDAAGVRVLFRPPAEASHYYRSESRDLALELLRYLATQDVRVVFSPRYVRQIEYLEAAPRWEHEPIVLREPVPFVSLLKGVDAVVSAGGTMLREAAYLGVPAYSIFRGRTGAVDRYLASIHRLSLLTSAADFSRIGLTQSRSISPLEKDSDAAETVMQMILQSA